jgi:hypothetical protein
VLISKIRLKPATIGVVRSAAMPQAMKHATREMNSSPIPGKTQPDLPFVVLGGLVS